MLPSGFVEKAESLTFLHIVLGLVRSFFWLSILLGKCIFSQNRSLENEQIEVDHILGSEQKVDILTKSLERIKFREIRDLIGVKVVSEDEFKLKGEYVG